MYVFAYGSLLNHRSAAGTIPGLRHAECIPALLAGHVRTFDVAFPNDGSQADKSYVGDDGVPPPAVLFANLRPGPASAAVNGVLLPIEEQDLARLVERERRYDVVRVVGVRPYAPWPAPVGRLLAFTGKRQFTDPTAVRAGVLGTDYLATIGAGVDEWEDRCAGFRTDFVRSTLTPPPDRIVPLRRIDAEPGSRRAGSGGPAERPAVQGPSRSAGGAFGADPDLGLRWPTPTTSPR